MTSVMKQPHGTSLETRRSLLHSLKSGDDPQSWQEFGGAFRIKSKGGMEFMLQDVRHRRIPRTR
jgi:hypothetical protein